MLKNFSKLTAVVVLSLGLAACKSPEEQAEEFYQSGLALMEAGDAERAIVEFQNVFQLNQNHKDARSALGHLMLAQDRTRQAYGHFLRVAEQYPEDVDSRIQLSEIAFRNRSWDEFERHGKVAIQFAPDLIRVRIIELGLAYQAASIAEDTGEIEKLASSAVELIPELPESRILRNILIDSEVRKGNIPAAIEHIDFLLNLSPDERPLYDQRLALVAQTQNSELIEQQLLLMIEKFPDDAGPQSSLLRLYVAEGNIEKAEDFLRTRSDPAAEDSGPFLDLIRFISETQGSEAAIPEIERGIAESPDPVPFRALRAGLNFSQGNQDEGIREMEAIIASVEESEHLKGVKVALAQMLIAQGNDVGARRLVEEVLNEDELQADALKMQAAWQIEADETDEAIANLRTAIDVNPNDTSAVELLAQAYSRSGSPDLAREFLALAVETSGNAPIQSLRYARSLMTEELYLPAEDVLIPSLRINPGHPQLLATLGQLYLAMGDVARSTQVIETLKRIDTDETLQIANALRAEQLQQQGGVEDAIRFLEGVTESDTTDLNAQMLLLRGRLANEDSDGALELIGKMISENPGNKQLPFALAAVKSATGDLAGAAIDYEALLEVNSNRPRVWLEYSRVLLRLGKEEEANIAIEQGLAMNADDPNLLWARASVLEQDNRIDEAIAIYEQLYDSTSNSIIVANNLASLLSARREDQESLDRAFTVARRFKDTETPALQDTYGWILHRMGDSEEALPYLESAAAALTRDALTQFHLAMTYIALGQTSDAVTQLQKTIDVAGPADTRSQIETARKELARLQTESQ